MPDPSERYSVLAGRPLLVVDFRAAQNLPSGTDLRLVRERLRCLACPSVALLDAAGTAARAAGLLASFDLCVDCEEDLGRVITAVERTPLAATVLAQLLRLTEKLDIWQALLAESLAYSALQAGPELAAWLSSRATPTPAATGAVEPAVLVRRLGACLHITLNRPERRNAYSTAMRDALSEALQVAVADSSVHQIIVDGRGPAFCSGGDLDEFGTRPDPATAHLIRTTRSPAQLLASCAERLRFNLHGACIGAGIELPAFARRVVARKDAYFQLPEVGMGLIPGAGGTVSITRRIGRQRTAYLAVSGARIDTATALAWGLIDEIADCG